MTIDHGMAPLWDAISAALESQRRMNGLSRGRFLGLHAGCGTTEVTTSKNSAVIDSATSDPKPIFETRLHCSVHDVDSAPEISSGE